MEKIEITREELYRRVWEKPVRQVAQEIGISDVGLKKTCVRLSVPSPPRGYWAKIEAGQKVSKANLPPPTEKTPAQTKIQIQDRSREIRVPRDAGEIPDIKYRVPQDLRGCDKMVSKTRDAILRDKYAHNGLYSPGRGDYGCLDLKVSKEQLQRALRIYQGIINGCTALGWKVNPGEEYSGTSILVEEEEISVAIREKTNRIENTEYSWRSYDFVPSGKLLFEIKTYCWRVQFQKVWNDTNTMELEERIDDILEGIHFCAAILRQQKIEEAEERRQRQIQERKKELQHQAEKVYWGYQQSKREELRAKIEEEKERRNLLGSFSKDLASANDIRGFIALAKQKTKVSEDWIDWASSIADLRDPFLNGQFDDLQRSKELDSSLDCGQNVEDLEFPVPKTVSEEMKRILETPIDL